MHDIDTRPFGGCSIEREPEIDPPSIDDLVEGCDIDFYPAPIGRGQEGRVSF